MSFELEGKLYKKFDTQQVSEKFSKREFVVEISKEVNDDVYTELVKFQITQDKCSVLDNYAEGSKVKVSFNLRGREWENKEGKLVYFTNLEAWRVDAASGNSSKSNTAATANPPSKNEDEDDDLPF